MSDSEIPSGAPDAVSRAAGQDATGGGSVAGAAPTGGAIDGAARPTIPGEAGVNDAGETVADDAEPPRGGAGS